MRKTYFLIAALSGVLCVNAVCSQSVEKKKLTIEQMFELAEQNNSSIKAHRLQEKQAYQEVKVAKNGYLPSINASLSFSYNGDGMIIDRDFGSYFKTEIPDFGNNFALEVSQIVYSGGATSANVRLSELKAQMTSLDAELNRQEIRFLIIGNYLELCKLENQLKVFDTNIAQTERILKDMHVRHNQGTALHNDITRYELLLQDLKYSKTTLQNNKQIINNQLTSTLGLSEATIIEPDTSDIKLLSDKSAEQWQKEAILSAIPIKLAAARIQINEQKKKLSYSYRLPKVALFATNNLIGPITMEIPAINKNFNCFVAGIGITYNFDNFYKSGRQLSSDKLGIMKARQDMTTTEEEIKLAIQSALIKYQESYSLLQTKEKSLELASENYNIVYYRYANDLALITDLLDASSQKIDAELQVVIARINILFNYFKLHYISGTL